VFALLKRLLFPNLHPPKWWQPLLDEIQSQRGHNACRGRVEPVLSCKEIRLEILRRGEKEFNRPLIINVGNELKDVFFIHPRSNEKITAENGITDFVSLALYICRGEKEFIVTRPDKATYK